MNNEKAILFANEAFYAAFNNQDMCAMNDAWSKSNEITCLHPGWPKLSGRKEVMNSWEVILNNEKSLGITCKFPTFKIHNNMAYVICYELIKSESLLATNIFIRENNRWRLTHHQAGVTTLTSQMPSANQLDILKTVQ